ncbi:MAG TPA: CoA transferase, partial [Acidimicrobiales bacterium]|nr:CoA transferase [Acidimicrobiales bacterium]
DLFERFPGAQYADHAVGNLELRAILREVFASRTSAEWVQLGERVNTPIVNVNTPQTIADDPQFQDRFPWLPREVLGAEQLPTPIKLIDEQQRVPSKAPTVGQHTDDVLREVLQYDDARIAALRARGALG